MSKFLPCVHFFRSSDRRIHLTSKVLELNRTLKITGSMVEEFFSFYLDLDAKEGGLLPVSLEKELHGRTEYEIWRIIHSFPRKNRRKVSSLKRDAEIEEIIRTYLGERLGKTWISFSYREIDIFIDEKDFGGVPDGEELDGDGNVISVLEIKTTQKLVNDRLNIPLSHLLQLSLYLKLRNLDTGYLSIAYLKDKDPERIVDVINKSKSPFEKIEGVCGKKTFKVSSWIKAFGDSEFGYEILEVYREAYDDRNEILCFKVKIDMEKFSVMMEKIKEWFFMYRRNSPQMNGDELKDLISMDRNN